MCRKGTGIYLKNHEGYTDLTAYKAIKNVSKTRRKAAGAKMSGLTYKIGELQQFQKARLTLVE